MRGQNPWNTIADVVRETRPFVPASLLDPPENEPLAVSTVFFGKSGNDPADTRRDARELSFVRFRFDCILRNMDLNEIEDNRYI